MPSPTGIAGVLAGPDVFALDVVITGALALALPLARGWAGARVGETQAQRGAAMRRLGLGMLAWLVLTGALGASGVLDVWTLPPRIVPLFVLLLLVTFGLAWSSDGRVLAEGLPWSVLIGYQVFRLPVEFMLHRAYEQHVIGVQMTWSGRNLDVVTALLAGLLGVWLWRRGESEPPARGLVLAWNLLGLGLLINIVTIAIASTPTFAAFPGPPNTFVAHFPYVWLPTVMVAAALFGHLLVFRRLRRDAAGARG